MNLFGEDPVKDPYAGPLDLPMKSLCCATAVIISDIILYVNGNAACGCGKLIKD